jgi:transcriptional regulator with XRE-family HTH domain
VVGKVIAYRLHRLGWTQQEIAEVIGMKSHSTYNRDFYTIFRVWKMV